MRARRLEPYAAGQAQTGDQPVEPARRAHLGPARPAHEHHHQPVRQLRRQAQQRGRGPQHHVGALQRLDPAREDQHDRVRGQSQPPPDVRNSCRGPEHGKVHARADGLHPPGRGAVQLDQLPRLVRRVGHQPVGGRHDLALAPDPDRGLGAVAAGQRQVLDLAQGVHGLHQRNPPALRGHRPHLTGQPVVRVHQVVPAGREVGLGAQHAEGERADLAGQRVLVEFLERPGHHVPDQYPGRELDDRRGVPADRAGEDLHLDAAPGQLPGHLDHVDVEPARVAGARLFERGGVQADRGDPPGGAPVTALLAKTGTQLRLHVHTQRRRVATCSHARLSSHEDAGAAPSRRERMELQGPVHRVGGRGALRHRGAGGRERGHAAGPFGTETSRGAYLGADPRDPDRQHRSGGSRPALAPDPQVLAAERAALRRAAGQGQGQDQAGVRRRAVHAVAPLL